MKSETNPVWCVFDAVRPRVVIVRAVTGEAAREMMLKLVLSRFVMVRHGQPRCASNQA
jgi:hypothetical protein